MNIFITVVGVILFLIITILFIGFLNQIGRALIGGLFTTENIELYFGSCPNDNDDSFKMKIGRFRLFFSKNYSWFQGSSRFLDTLFLSIQKKIINIAGTFLSLLLAVAIYYVTMKFDVYDFVRAASVIFIVCTIFNLIIPFVSTSDFIEEPIGTTLDNYMYDRNGNHSDIDIELTNLLQEGVKSFSNQEYEKAISPLKELRSHTNKILLTNDLLFQSYLMTKQYIEAEKFVDYLEKKISLDSNRYCQFALAKAHTQQYEKSLYYYEKSLELDKKNAITLNNRGYTYNLLEEYEKAILDFNEAIRLDSASAYSYNNRGLAKIKLGQTEEGLKDIQVSMELDNQNSYAYRNLGIYHFEKKQYKIALSYFEKSYELDKETHLIEEHIKETKDILKKLD
ncbi:tetratricopeptide repeat protein [Bernardetia sp. ABR2-2B]|uniref:tetratricopeptide repeat protein n=1 Tax=Bernardetia sp. ABR2-2B TaxID=3127472 RepID=UPI0030CD17C5